jgi:hypothetical protein
MKTEAWGKKARLMTALGKKKWWYACMLFGTNGLNEGVV